MLGIPLSARLMVARWGAGSPAAYGLAVLLTVSATALTLLLRPILEQSVSVLYTVAVVVAAWRGGLGPGVLASLSAALALAYFFVDPVDSLAINSLTSLLQLAVFLFVATLLGGATAARRQARHEEAEQRAWLEARVRERTLALENALAELRALASRMEAAREEERVRLAREVHDELGSALTGLKMDVSRLKGAAAQPEAVVAGLAALSGELDQLVVAVRRIASELRPSVLDDLGLPAALEWQLEELRRRTGLETMLTASADEAAITPEVATALFRVFQEALTNIARHAQAQRVEVELEQNHQAMRLQVRDDGCGFEVHRAGQRRSFGLSGMRERVRLLGGHLVVHSQPGAGTRIDVYVPVSAPPDDA